MILSDSKILEAIEAGEIVIEPFDRSLLGSNSYDVHLSRHLAVYEDQLLDAKAHNKVRHFEIPEEGYILEPGKFYLGSTLEYTESHKHVPYLDGKSSTGRLGVVVHYTAGRGDIGFCNFWTFEISVIQPIRIYAGMPIGQLTYHTVEGTVEVPYNKKNNAKFTQLDPRPKESMMFKNTFLDGQIDVQLPLKTKQNAAHC